MFIYQNGPANAILLSIDPNEWIAQPNTIKGRTTTLIVHHVRRLALWCISASSQILSVYIEKMYSTQYNAVSIYEQRVLPFISWWQTDK